MARPTNIPHQNILDYLAKTGPQRAKEICQHFELSQPTVSRFISQSQNVVVTIGRGRQTQYAVLKNGTWGGSKIPVFVVNELGETSSIATLYPVYPHHFYFESHVKNFSSQVYENLPYYFWDLRPAGFLGRLIPRLYPDLGVPNDITVWTDEHCLNYLVRYGFDLIGSFIVGEQANNLWKQNRIKQTEFIHEKDRPIQFSRLADLVLSHGLPGSSAAGEQPKFLSIVSANKKWRPVLVKFSPPLGDAVGQRVADLLVCEHLAHQVLKQNKIVSLESQLVYGGNRLFLETDRFDRTDKDGRKGVISLQALDLQFVGQLKSWSESAATLFQQKRIDQNMYQTIVWLEVFGKLIANTDRHHGNISFFCDGEQITGLAPVYDMLPMLYAPQQNQLVERTFDPAPPTQLETPVWPNALAAARCFWTLVQEHPHISSNFKKLVVDNFHKLSKL